MPKLKRKTCMSHLWILEFQVRNKVYAQNSFPETDMNKMKKRVDLLKLRNFLTELWAISIAGLTMTTPPSAKTQFQYTVKTCSVKKAKTQATNVSLGNLYWTSLCKGQASSSWIITERTPEILEKIKLKCRKRCLMSNRYWRKMISLTILWPWHKMKGLKMLSSTMWLMNQLHLP